LSIGWPLAKRHPNGKVARKRTKGRQAAIQNRHYSEEDDALMSFMAPVRQMSFALHEIVNAGKLYGGAANPDLTRDLADAVLEEAGKFASGVLAPLNKAGDKSGAVYAEGRVRLSPGFAEAYGQFVAGGWNAVAGDPAFGGQGLPHTIGVAVQEFWQSANMAFGLCPILTQGAIEALGAHGTPEQKQTYLPKLISGEWTGTMNLTEPHAGSDVGALSAKAVPEAGGSFRIAGQKIFITWGEHEAARNIVHLVLARLPDAPFGTRGISLFLVPKFLPGPDGGPGERNDVRCVGVEYKLGIHGSPTCTMAYGERGGAKGWLIGAPNKGMAAMFTMMNAARLNVGVQGVAVAERAFQQALAYAKERRQGKPYGLSHEIPDMIPIIQHADVRRMLLTMRACVEAGRAICLATALALDEARYGGGDAAKGREELLTPIAKAWCTDMAVEVASLGVQVHGGMGFVEETGAAQHYRDARILPIYEGTNGIQAIDLIGRKLGLQNGAPFRALMEEIEASAARLERAGGPLAAAGAAIQRARAHMEQTAGTSLAALRTEPARALAGATPLLRAMGLLAGAHFLGVGALAARRRLDEDAPDADFFQARIHSACFFAANLLPHAHACLDAAAKGADAIVGATVDQLSA
jgi:alkylation response protein AidB-like acyl-CoA dehydrogenase